ncbi:MAG TPA: hypothetical protein VMU22_06470 [Rhizomicrobium sp.]|nr:hypothetical protein [Rhizomicrobium sp.]
MAGPATTSDPAATGDGAAVIDDAATATDTAGATSTSATTTAARAVTHAANKPAAKAAKPVKQAYTVVEASGINIAAHSTFDLNKPVNLKKGQMLILKSSSGQMIEVDGPLQGKPADHFTAISDGGTMGFDAKSFTPPGGHGHCSGGGAPHPAGGPNPDETGGAENQATHCQ